MDEALEKIKNEILESDFAKSYMDKPAVKRLYELEVIETDDLNFSDGRIEVPSYSNLPQKIRDCKKRGKIAEYMVGGLYHSYLKKRATDILLPKVEHAFHNLQEFDENNVFNVPQIADIVKEELGKSNRYYTEALKLINEWQKLGILVENKCIDIDTAELSCERKAAIWCGTIEVSRAYSLAYIFASLQPGEDWACARDLVVFDISGCKYDVMPYIAAWHEFEHPEAVRRISDFDFSDATKVGAQPARGREQSEGTDWYIR